MLHADILIEIAKVWHAGVSKVQVQVLAIGSADKKLEGYTLSSTSCRHLGKLEGGLFERAQDSSLRMALLDFGNWCRIQMDA